MSELMLDVGLAQKLKVAFARNGWDVELIDELCRGDTLRDFRKVLKGKALMIESHEVIINPGLAPRVPPGWEVVKHLEREFFHWHPDKVDRAMVNEYGEVPTGRRILRESLTERPWLNASFLDFLLGHKYFIPKDWRGMTLFLGTIYRSKNMERGVRYLLRRLDGWEDGIISFERDWSGCRLAYSYEGPRFTDSVI